MANFPDKEEYVMNQTLDWVLSYGTQMIDSCPEWNLKNIPNVNKWVADNWHKAPMLSAFVDHLASNDSNTTYTITGSRNVVNRLKKVFASPHVAADISGWSQYIKASRTLYMTHSLGALTRLHFDEPTMRVTDIDLYPNSLVKLDINEKPNLMSIVPGKYYGERIDEYRYIRINQRVLPQYHGHGIPDAYVASQLICTMTLYWKYLYGSLSSESLNGILSIGGWSELAKAGKNSNREGENQLDKAMARKNEALQNSNIDWRKHLLLIASQAGINVDYLPIAKLPDHIGSIREFLDTIAVLMAAITKTDVNAVWDVQSGSFGSSEKSKTSRHSASDTAERDYLLAYQNQVMEKIVPVNSRNEPLAVFEFEFESTETQQGRADIDNQVLQNATLMRDLGMSKDEYKDYLFRNGVISSAETDSDLEQVDSSGTVQRSLYDSLNRHQKSVLRDELIDIAYAMKHEKQNDPIVTSKSTGSFKYLGLPSDFTKRHFY